jgi:superfamily I DNA/RNA helicase
MDSMELARRSAAELHDRLAQGGADPWDSFALVTAAAMSFDYEIEATAPGSAGLHGSRACLIPDERTILHENVGTPFDWAFLIGHELGHLMLGDAGHPTQSCEFDAGRPSERAPVGFDRVVDYSEHQRREVQMDLFSRELILPRAWARRLHVDDGLTAEAIAERLGAPNRFVAQQLFDALLLPRVEPRVEVKQGPSLNEDQRRAARHLGIPFLLEAGPGTGKTQTLTARVEFLLDNEVAPSRLLLLTFSNKAAGEMTERVARIDPDAAATMWMGTFHAFGLELVRLYHAELGLPADPRLLDRVEAAELLEREFPKLDLRHYRNLYDPTQTILDVLAAISRAKDEVADPIRYRECAEAMLRKASENPQEVEVAEKALEIARIYEAYEQLKRKAGAVDFGDLVMLPVILLRGDQQIRDKARARFDHVLVDEFQDVNRASVQLLEELTGGGAELWAVGDARQSIYRFRGASAYNVARFGTEDFPGGKRDRLTVNYRSTKEIVDAFSKFASEMPGEVSALVADRGVSGNSPQFLRTGQNREQLAGLAETILTLKRDGIDYRDQAVLCTGNERLTKTARALERMGIPVLFLGSLFERPEIKDLLSFMSLLVDPRAMGLVKVATMPDFAMSIADVGVALEHYRLEERPEPGIPDAPPNLTKEGLAAFSKLRAALVGMDATSSPWTVIAKLLLDRSRVAARIAETEDVGLRAQGIAIWQFMNFIATQPGGRGYPITRLLDRIRRLVRLSEEHDLRQMPAAAQGLDAVRLMTVHGAKGLEFRAVHLPGLNTGTLPRSFQPPKCPAPDGLIQGTSGDAATAAKLAHQQEQECLFYVAMSRARDRLFLSAARFKANSHRWGASEFVVRLAGVVEERDIAPVMTLPEDPEDRLVDVQTAGSLKFAASQVGLYESCARRFFYTHLLKVGGRRLRSSFMRMHEAVSAVVAEIAAGTADGLPIRQRVEQACRDCGLGDDPQLSAYVDLAGQLVEFFHASREGMTPLEAVEFRLVVDGHEILFSPDEMLRAPSGATHIRRIRTGHARSKDATDATASALKLAVAAEAADALIELVHLSDGTITPLVPSGRGDGGRAKLAAILQNVGEGRFPLTRSQFTCPGCPAFFICGTLPDGPFEINC